LCRPELSPGFAIVDSADSLARRATMYLEENCADNLSLEQIAKRLGCSDRQLRRVFAAELHITPIQYLQTCRLLLAKNLLTDSRLSITEVAMASGFGSLRRFNVLFQKHYRTAPSLFRRKASKINDQTSWVTVQLGYRPPYRWREILDFLSHRAIPCVELVKDNEYLRVAQIGGASGTVKIADNPKQNTLKVTISESLLPVLPQVLARVRGLFDLYCQPTAVYEVLCAMNQLSPGLCEIGTRLPGCFDPFEISVRAILGQQITVKAAQTLAARVAEALGAPLETGIPELSRAFPSAAIFVKLGESVEDVLGRLGVTKTRSKSVLALARSLESGELTLTNPVDPLEEIRKLIALPGIGEWTANYIAMRAMSWTDAFPHTDYGVMKALAPYSPKEILPVAKAWKPWRAYAVINLWNSLKDK
jgi:AraC family transcriptional regulator of adaptative response / DNA-3-methyladenine glycosylase II